MKDHEETARRLNEQMWLILVAGAAVVGFGVGCLVTMILCA